MYDIVKFDDDVGNAVTLTPEDVVNIFCQNATFKEIQMFLALCATKKLNPFTREVYLVKYGNAPAQIVVGRDAFRKRALLAPDFGGIDEGVVVLNSNGTIERVDGEAYYPEIGQQLLGGWARVYRRNLKPFYAEVSLKEYSTGKAQWQKMPGTMIVKVAEGHAFRSAFPSILDGMYIPEEMGQASIVEQDDAIAAPIEVEITNDVPVQNMPAQDVEIGQSSSNDDDQARLRDALNRLVAHGYGRDSCHKWLSDIYRTKGIEAALDEARILAEKRIGAQENDS